MTTDTLQARAKEVIQLFGSVRAAADAIGLDAAYLHRLSTGAKFNPSDRALSALGLRRIVTYERIPVNIATHTGRPTGEIGWNRKRLPSAKPKPGAWA